MGIHTESTIQLLTDNRKFTLYVEKNIEIPEEKGSQVGQNLRYEKTIELQVEPTDSIRHVKTLLYNKEGPACPVGKQTLTCERSRKTRTMKDSKTLADYGIGTLPKA